MTMSSNQRSQWRLGPRAGFSLVEALLAVILLGITAAYAFPVVERGAMRSKADRAANVIANEMRNAYSLSARQRKPVTIGVNSANRTLTIADRAAGTVFVRQNFSTAQSPYGLTALNASAATITVFPNGVASDTLRVTLSVGPNQRVVRMTRVGQVRVQ